MRARCQAILTLTFLSLSSPALAGCILGRLGELAVTMKGMQPVVTAQVNGADAQFVVDTGAFYSMISPQAATALNLKLASAPPRSLAR
jgi:hypothetical protein